MKTSFKILKSKQLKTATPSAYMAPYQKWRFIPLKSILITIKLFKEVYQMKRNIKVYISLFFLTCSVMPFNVEAQSTTYQFLYNGSHYEYEFNSISYGRKIEVKLLKNVVLGNPVIPVKQSSQPLSRHFTKEDFYNTAYFLLQEFESKAQLDGDKTTVDATIEKAYNKLIQDLNDPKHGLVTAVDNLDGLDKQIIAGEVTLLKESLDLEELFEEDVEKTKFFGRDNGKFFLIKKKKVKGYKFEDSKEKLKINRVAIEFSNTLINKVTIDGELEGERIVINPESYAISINSLNSNKEKVVFNHGKNTYRMNYGSLLRIYPNTETGVLKKNFGDNLITISPTNKTAPAFSRGFSDYISAIVFTDLVGVEDESPNGLLQTEVKAFLPLTSNSLWFKRKIRLFSQIEPHINISKIGGKNYFVETGAIEGGENEMFVNPFNLLRFNNLNFGLKLRLLWIVLPSVSSEIAINGSLNGYRTGLKQRYLDANTGKDEFREFNVFSYAPEVSGSFILKPDNWIGVSFSEGVTKLNLLDADVLPSYGNIRRFRDNLYNGTTSENYFNENFFHFTDVTAFISPSQTRKGGIFVRTRFFKNFSTTNNFYQFQIGYSTDVRNFVNTRK